MKSAGFPYDVYKFLISGVRSGDKAGVLERFMGGQQEVFEETHSKIQTLDYLTDPVLCPEDQLDFLLALVGWDGSIGQSFVETLLVSQKRKLIKLSADLWKTKGTPGNLIDALRIFTGKTAVVDDYFFSRLLIDASSFQFTTQLNDSWITGGMFTEWDEYFFWLLVNRQNLDESDRRLIYDLLSYIRPALEHIGVLYCSFLDNFDTGGLERWSETGVPGQAEVTADRKLKLNPSGAVEPNLTEEELSTWHDAWVFTCGVQFGPGTAALEGVQIAWNAEPTVGLVASTYRLTIRANGFMTLGIIPAGGIGSLVSFGTHALPAVDPTTLLTPMFGIAMKVESISAAEVKVSVLYNGVLIGEETLVGAQAWWQAARSCTIERFGIDANFDVLVDNVIILSPPFRVQMIGQLPLGPSQIADPDPGVFPFDTSTGTAVASPTVVYDSVDRGGFVSDYPGGDWFYAPNNGTFPTNYLSPFGGKAMWWADETGLGMAAGALLFGWSAQSGGLDPFFNSMNPFAAADIREHSTTGHKFLCFGGGWQYGEAFLGGTLVGTGLEENAAALGRISPDCSGTGYFAYIFQGGTTGHPSVDTRYLQKTTGMNGPITVSYQFAQGWFQETMPTCLDMERPEPSQNEDLTFEYSVDGGAWIEAAAHDPDDANWGNLIGWQQNTVTINETGVIRFRWAMYRYNQTQDEWAVTNIRAEETPQEERYIESNGTFSGPAFVTQEFGQGVWDNAAAPGTPHLGLEYPEPDLISGWRFQINHTGTWEDVSVTLSTPANQGDIFGTHTIQSFIDVPIGTAWSFRCVQLEHTALQTAHAEWGLRSLDIHQARSGAFPVGLSTTEPNYIGIGEFPANQGALQYWGGPTFGAPSYDPERYDLFMDVWYHKPYNPAVTAAGQLPEVYEKLYIGCFGQSGIWIQIAEADDGEPRDHESVDLTIPPSWNFDPRFYNYNDSSEMLGRRWFRCRRFKVPDGEWGGADFSAAVFFEGRESVYGPYLETDIGMCVVRWRMSFVRKE